MTPEQIRAEYLDAIGEVGEPVAIRIYSGTSETYADSTVRARVVEFAADQLVGAIVQGDRKLIMLAADVETAGVTITATQNCKCVVRGKECQIKSIDDNTRRVAGVLMAYELTVGG
jgi:hypothetical protein